MLVGLAWRFPCRVRALAGRVRTTRVHMAFRRWYAAHVGSALAPAFPLAAPVVDGACLAVVASSEGIPRVRQVEIRVIADYGGIGVGFLPD